MVSNIDPTFPVAGIDQPSQGFRDNFQYAKTEIEALQSDVTSLQANPVINVINDISDVDTTTTPPIIGDVLTYDGINWAPLAPPAATAMQDLIDDLTPQLGGDLDVNGFFITVNNILTDTIQMVGRIKVIDDNSALASANLQVYSNNPSNADGSFISARRSRGSHVSPTAAEVNDVIGDYAHRAFDGTNYSRNFYIRTTATENQTPTTLGSETIVYSTANGDSAASSRIRIDETGQLHFNEFSGVYLLSNDTTDDTLTELFVNGDGSTRLELPDDTTWLFKVSIVARRTDADDESAGYTFEGVIDRNSGAGTTMIVGAVSKSVIAEDTTDWDAFVDADSGNGSLRVTVMGSPSTPKDVTWIAKVETVELTG